MLEMENDNSTNAGNFSSSVESADLAVSSIEYEVECI